MIAESAESKRKQFKRLLFKLAEEQDLLSTEQKKREIFQQLEELYHDTGDTEEFRHFYSDIFAVLTEIDNDASLGNTEILSQNMNIVRQEYRPVGRDARGEFNDVTKHINKLYDHINLDISRLNYSKTIESRSRSELQKVEETLHSMEKSLKSMEDAVDGAADMQKQYITILGIFAAIVLAFTGGIAFSTSVLENISAPSIYRLLLVAVGLAFVLINIIYILTRFIMEISQNGDKTIKYPGYMKVLNGLCAGAVFLIFVWWFFDIGHAAELLRRALYPAG